MTNWKILFSLRLDLCSYLFNWIPVLLSLVLLAHCFPAKQGHTTNHLSSTAAIEHCQNVGAVRATINPRKRSVYRNSSRKKQSLSCITQLLRRLRRNPSPDTILSRHGCVSCCGHLNIKPATCPVLDTSLFLLMQGGEICHNG